MLHLWWMATKGTHLLISLDMACAEQTKAMEFASIMTIGDEAELKGKKCQN